jgi:1-acyl-sn-glycerol-3-phosphate acyltransferase
LPVVPLSIVGSRHIMLKGRLATYPGRVKLVVHQPIDTRGLAGGDSRAFAERVREIVASAAETDLHRHPPDTVAA